MSKTIYIQKQNHMDPIWRRGWKNHPLYRDSYIRSYAQIEELIINSDLSLMEILPKYVTSIEQTVTIREYLERNPDMEEKIKALVKNGNIDLLSGGETVIDYNMPDGESIVRNFLYANLWYEKEFGIKNKTVIVPDTFGMNAQLPQIFKKLGFDFVAMICRSLQDRKDYWKGLDGEIICYTNTEHIVKNKHDAVMLESYEKYNECPECKGDGCFICNYSGLDLESYTYNDAALVRGKATIGNVIEKGFSEAINSKSDEVFMMINSEEIIQNEAFVKMVNKAEEQGVTVKYIKKEYEYERFAGEKRAALNNINEIPDNLIDERSEGERVSTGCYTSRIKLKLMNRLCERLLIKTENLAALACINKNDYYPAKKIELLWRKMAMTQFHDAITATHTDFAYRELINMYQDIKLAGTQILDSAAHYLKNGDGFSVYNPYNFEMTNIFKAVFSSDTEYNWASVTDKNGKKLPVASVKSLYLTERREHERYRVTVEFLAVIPPQSAITVQISNGVSNEITKETAIKNEFYEIEFDKHGIASIFDKCINKEITKRCGHLFMEEDFGSPWETLAKPFNSSNLRNYGQVTEIYSDSVKSWAIIEGSYDESEKTYTGRPDMENKVSWKQTITLTSGLKRVDFKTEILWNTHGRRLKVLFPTNINTNEAVYSIPYGNMKKACYTPVFGKHSDPNGEYPVINHCTVCGDGYSLALMNKGTPAHRVENGIIELTLLRSPELPVFIYDFEGALDKGQHVFDFALYTSEKPFISSDIPRIAEIYNYHNICTNGELKINDNIIVKAETATLSVLKKAESGNAYILRIYETNGKKCKLYIKNVKKISVCDLLENILIDVEGALTLKPYEILTLKVTI